MTNTRQDRQTRTDVPLFRPALSVGSIERAIEVLRSPWLGLGPVTEEFECRFAAFVGARHAVAVNSGTAALHLAMRLLGIGPGDEVVLPAITYVATGHVILLAGATAVFVDIDPATGHLDPAHLRAVLSPRTAAVVAVHYAGAPCRLDEIYGIARQAGVPVVEDCAHACGASYGGRPIGAGPTLQAFSFNATKNLAVGEGGALVVPDASNAERARRLRRLGIAPPDAVDVVGNGWQPRGTWDYAVLEVGFKYNMSDIQAAIGLGELEVLPEGNRKRAELACRYRDHLRQVPGVELLDHPIDAASSNFLMPVLAEQRDALAAALSERGIGTSVHFRRLDSYPPERNRLESLARNTGLTRRVGFLGEVPLQTAASLLRGAVLTVVPSLSEGGGLVNVEAQAAGCPVVATDIGGIREYLGCAAHFVRPADATGLAEGIVKIITDDSYRDMLIQAGIHNAALLDWSKLTQDYLGDYQVLRDTATKAPFRPWSALTKLLWDELTDRRFPRDAEWEAQRSRQEQLLADAPEGFFDLGPSGRRWYYSGVVAGQRRQQLNETARWAQDLALDRSPTLVASALAEAAEWGRFDRAGVRAYLTCGKEIG